MSFLKEYTILAELGQGGFAKVYKVRHDALGYIRAIRVLNEPVTDESSSTYQKFLRECKVLLRLGNGSHRNIVHIYQPRLLDNHALVEMDYVDGQDLTHYLKANGSFVPTDEVLRMVEQMSSALAYCHEDIYKFCMDREADNLQDDPMDGSRVLVDEPTCKRLIEKYKVIHNDIHSGNIMRREDGDFVLLDFGLAITDGDDVCKSSRHENGAVEYKAPEKWDKEALLTEQSDIYSFGIVMYEYLAGRVPFPFDKTISKPEAEFKVLKAHREQTPLPISDLRKANYEAKYSGQAYQKDYPDWLEAAIMKCLEKDPSKRFRNGKELHEFVMRHLAEKSKKSPQVVYVPIIEKQPKTGRMDQPPYDDPKEELPLTPKQQAYAGARTEKYEPEDEEQASPVSPVTRIPEPTPTTQKATADKPKGKKGLWIGLGIAVVAAAVAIVAVLHLRQPKPNEMKGMSITYAYNGENESSYTLPDGTWISFNSESVITYPKYFDNSKRSVNFEGVAYFDVATDEARPFVIHCNNIDVEVLGTYFLLNADKDAERYTLDLYTGKVKMTAFDNDRQALSQIEVNPGERGVWNVSGSELKAMTYFEVKEDQLLTEHVLVFNDEKLSKIVEAVEYIYKVDIDLSEACASKTLTVRIDDEESIDDVLKTIASASESTVIKTDKGYRIR